MEKYPIAIATGDWHIRYTLQNRVIIQSIFKAIDEIVKAALKHKVPILFTGDIGQSDKHLPNQVFVYMMSYFGGLDRIGDSSDLHILGVNGNHDQPESSSIEGGIPEGYFTGLMRAFPNICTCIDMRHRHLEGANGVRVWGIPYLSDDRGFKEYIKKVRLEIKKTKRYKHILLYHGDLPGAKDTDNREVGSSLLTDYSLFKGFDLVIAGHIHKYQVLHKNVIIVGSITHQRRTDMGCKMGYVIIYNDLSHKFVPLKGYPEFKEYDPDTEKPTNDTDFWIPIKKVEVEEGTGEEKKTLNINNRVRIVKTYCKKNNIASKRKVKTIIRLIKETD